MSTPTATDLARAARYRNIEKLQPGYWWSGEYGVDEASAQLLWAQASMILEFEQLTTKRRFVRVLGRATDGMAVELVQFRGYSVESLTERQGDKLGLTLPEPEDDDPGDPAA
jgi:hypothetical protein